MSSAEERQPYNARNRRFVIPAVIRYPLVIILGLAVGVLGSYVLRKLGY